MKWTLKKWTLKHWSTNLRGWSIILKLPIEFKHRVEGQTFSVYCLQMMAWSAVVDCFQMCIFQLFLHALLHF